MALKYEKPNPALMRELDYVARDAKDLSRALCDANYLPEAFPLDEITDILKTLEALPHGTAEGCRIPLDHGRLRLAEIGQRHIDPEDDGDDERKEDSRPALMRGMAVDQAFGRLILQISYAQAQYREQAGKADGDDNEAELIVRPDSSVKADLDSIRGEAINLEKSYRDLGDDLKKKTKPESEHADQLIRQANDVEGHARLAKNEVQKTEIRASRFKKIAAFMRRLPKIIESTGKTIVVGVDVAEPFVKQWSKFWDTVLDLQIKNLREFGENLQKVGQRLQKGANQRKPFDVFRDITVPWCPEMILLPPGEFLMGSPDNQTGTYHGEGPEHEVTISKAFLLGRYAITFAEYDHFCEVTRRKKPDDSGWGRGRRPVINVFYDDAVAYCAWLSKETGRHYHLPSEAQWEYACRAGTTTAFSFGDEISKRQANIDRSVGKTAEVGSYPANPWGFYDMHGNVWEWCAGWYSEHPSLDATVDQKPDRASDGRVLRGGSWMLVAQHARSAYRSRFEHGNRISDVGFRCARVQEL